jgi:serine/threonine protein kinase
MDFCSKGELFNYIVEKQHLSEEKSAFFYYQLINGIEYIHKKGVCHRDLKPENLLLTEKNKLKIIDFGLSNYFKGNLLETPCGSPCYASPEMVMGNKYNGFCIDIWSSGIILYAMLCGYLPFEEMENDEYNEVLFRNIVECNVEYPSEFVTPVAKDLLCKILVKDPRKRITIEEIKLHNFYLLGELLYKQTFENMGNMNDYLFLVDDKDKYIEYADLKDKDIEEIVLNDNCLKLNDKILTNFEEYEKELELLNEKEINKTEKNKTKDKKDNNTDLIIEVKNFDKEKTTTDKNENNNSTPILSDDKKNDKTHKNNYEKKETKTNYEKNEKIEKNDSKVKTKELNTDQKREEIFEEINKKEKNGSNKKNNKNNGKKKSPKKAKSKELFQPKDEQKKSTIKQLSLETYHNIQIPISNHDEKKYKGNVLQNSLKIKKSKTNKEEKSLREYSIQDEYTNTNKNSNDINIKTQYLKTEIYPSNSKNKTKTKKYNYQCKLLNKKIVNNKKTAFDNILKSLQTKTNNIKSKTPKRYSTKKNAPIKQNSNQSNSTMRRKYCSYSPGIRKISKDGINIINNIDKNINFHKKNSNNNNIKKYNYNLLSDNVLKFVSNSNFYFHYDYRNKNFKPNKKFIQKKNDKNEKKTINNTNNINSINSINNDNYFRTNNNIKNKNNDEKKLFQSSMNNPLTRKIFDYCLSSNTSKKKHLVVDKKINNNINNDNNKIYYIILIV